jgi:dipeptidyl aminopeptidase/acylaminoacyl peptidase
MPWLGRPLRAADVQLVTVEDVLYLESASGFDVSPDGKWIAWVKTTPDKDKSALKQNIFLSSTTDTMMIALTVSTIDDRSPAFSPDGTKLAFLSARDKTPAQIYVYDMHGGEPVKLTEGKTGVDRFEWRDADRILFAAREDSTLRERTLRKNKDATIIVADQEHYPPVRLFEISIDKKETTRVTSNPGAVIEFAVSPDGRWVITNENVDVNFEYDYRNPPIQFLVDLSSGERREVMSVPFVAPYDFQWDAKGDGVYCRRAVSSDSTDTYVSIDELYYFDLRTEALRRVDAGMENGLGSRYVVVEDGVVAAMADGARDRIVHLKTSGHRVLKKETLAGEGRRNIRLAAGARNGSRIVYSISNASTVPDIMTATVRRGSLAGEKTLVKLNKSLRGKTLARSEVIRWNGALGDEVEGILYYPIGYEEGKTYPLIASIHGGPSAADLDFFAASWGDYPHLLAGKGAFVLNVNYHGSGNYGLRWVESIKGHYYEYEVPDILTGIDYLIDRGLADPERLGITGWSNGSILAIEAALSSGRFKALCAGAGDVNWTSDYGNCAFGAAFDNAYFGGPPWDHPETYFQKSPYFRLREMKTPTLIMFGTRDTSVPTEQGWQHFRAMQQSGSAPVRFLLFPDEPHGLQKLAHRKRKMEEEISWLDRYLFDARVPSNEAYDPSSPLAAALVKVRAARDGAIYGEIVNGLLVPEVVGYEGMKVGRFEVTRAQFRVFDPDYIVAPGTENYPANDVPYEMAERYCAWLGKTTGRSFRLPTSAEMDRLIDASGSNAAHENNLDRWAGFSPSPDDLALLEPKIAELEDSRLLIEEAGSFPPAIRDPSGVADETVNARTAIYDLEGNVAEWTSESGVGRVMGLSAVTPKDPSIPYTAPRAAYVGFRVIAE